MQSARVFALLLVGHRTGTESAQNCTACEYWRFNLDKTISSYHLFIVFKYQLSISISLQTRTVDYHRPPSLRPLSADHYQLRLSTLTIHFDHLERNLNERNNYNSFCCKFGAALKNKHKKRLNFLSRRLLPKSEISETSTVYQTAFAKDAVSEKRFAPVTRVLILMCKLKLFCRLKAHGAAG